MHDGISSRGDFVLTLPHKCLLPSVRKTSLSPGPQGAGFWSLPSFHPVCSTHRRKQWAAEVPERALVQPGSCLPAPQRPPSVAPATCSLATSGRTKAGCPVLPGSRFSVAECPLSLPPPSLFTVHPLLLPGSLALLLGSSLLRFCLSSGHQVDKQVLSGLLPSLGDWLPFRTYWGGWLLRAGSPITGETTLTSPHPGTYILPLLP